jgi:thiol-disulfide isomerase/thioredoxin
LAVLLLLSLTTLSAGAQQASGESIPSATLEILQQEQRIKQLLDQSLGAPVLVNFWATWCEPCVEEMPDFVRFYNHHSESGLQMLSFSADFPSDAKTRVAEFMKQFKMPFPVYVAGDLNPNQFVALFSKEWFGTLPATFFFDSQGTLVKSWTGRVHYKDLQEIIVPVLSEKDNNPSSE